MALDAYQPPSAVSLDHEPVAVADWAVGPLSLADGAAVVLAVDTETACATLLGVGNGPIAGKVEVLRLFASTILCRKNACWAASA